MSGSNIGLNIVIRVEFPVCYDLLSAYLANVCQTKIRGLEL